MDKKLKDQLTRERNERIKKKNGKFLKMFLLIFIVGYAFFFTSNFILPVATPKITATPIGKAQEVNHRSVTVVSWDYSKEDDEMEIILEISNNSLDGINRYRFSAVEKTKGRIDCQMVLQRNDFVVLHLTDVPGRFSEISLRMLIPAGNDTEESEMRFYTHKDAVTYVNDIKTRDEESYRLLAIDKKIENSKQLIEQYENDIKTERKKITEADKRIAEIDKNIKYLAGDDLENAQSDRSTLVSDVSRAEGNIENLSKQIEDEKAKITLQEAKRKEIQNE